jgi:hypothetical protein
MNTKKRPTNLTANPDPDNAIPDAEYNQRLLDIAARADVYEAIRQGEDDIANGRTRPARESFKEFRRRHGIPR